MNKLELWFRQNVLQQEFIFNYKPEEIHYSRDERSSILKNIFYSCRKENFRDDYDLVLQDYIRATLSQIPATYLNSENLNPIIDRTLSSLINDSFFKKRLKIEAYLPKIKDVLYNEKVDILLAGVWKDTVFIYSTKLFNKRKHLLMLTSKLERELSNEYRVVFQGNNIYVEAKGDML